MMFKQANDSVNDLQASSQDIRSVAALVKNRTKTWRRWCLLLGIVFVLMISFSAISMVMLMQGVISGNWQPLFAHPVIGILGGSSAGVFSSMVLHSAPLLKSLQPDPKGLLEVEDLNAVGHIIEMVAVLGRNDTELKRILIVVLCRLLPKIDRSKAHLITTAQRRALHRILMKERWSGANWPFAVSILYALAPIGDLEAIPCLKVLSSARTGDSWGYLPEQIQMAAHTCLAELQQIKQDSNEHVLLRGSRTPQPSSVELVRPAAKSTHTDSNELLRVGEVDHTHSGTEHIR